MYNVDNIYFGSLITIESIIFIIVIIIKAKRKNLTFKSILFNIYMFISIFLWAYSNRYQVIDSRIILSQLVFIVGIVYGKYNAISYIVSIGGLVFGLIILDILPTGIDLITIGLYGLIFFFSPEITGYLNERRMKLIGAIEVSARCIGYKKIYGGKIENFAGSPVEYIPIYEFYIDEKRYTARPVFGTYLNKKYIVQVGDVEIIYINPKNPNNIYIPLTQQNYELRVVSLIPSLLAILTGIIIFFVTFIVK